MTSNTNFKRPLKPISNDLYHLPRLHLIANWIALPPAPQKASTIVSQEHLQAMCLAIFSGVTLNQLSERSFMYATIVNIIIIINNNNKLNANE